VNIGNDWANYVRATGTTPEHRYMYEDYILDALYTVKELEITKAPNEVLANEKFYSDYLYEKAWNEKDEWFYNYLQDTEITVHYYGTEETKIAVANPDIEKGELSLWTLFKRGAALTGPTTRIQRPAQRGAAPNSGDYYPASYLVFIHENAERYSETNIEAYMAKSVGFGPVKVYVLQGDLEIESTDGDDIRFPINPVASQGSVESFLSKLSITATWIYQDIETGDEEEVTRTINPVNNPRLSIVNSDPPVTIDNKTTGGTGMYEAGYWARTGTQSARIEYTDYKNPTGEQILGATRLGRGQVSVERYDPLQE